MHPGRLLVCVYRRAARLPVAMHLSSRVWPLLIDDARDINNSLASRQLTDKLMLVYTRESCKTMSPVSERWEYGKPYIYGQLPGNKPEIRSVGKWRRFPVDYTIAYPKGDTSEW